MSLFKFFQKKPVIKGRIGFFGLGGLVVDGFHRIRKRVYTRPVQANGLR